MNANLPTGETMNEGSNVPPAEDMVEIHLNVPMADLEKVKEILGMINDAVQGASAKAASDINTQKGAEDMGGLEDFGEELNRR